MSEEQPRAPDGKFAPKPTPEPKEEHDVSAELEAIRKENAEMKAMLQKQETEKELIKFEKERADIMNELSEWPALVKKYADTKDLDRLRDVLETAKEFKNEFPDYNNPDNEPEPVKQYVKPKMYK